ncbi:hypothetical protein [uncultured Roseovarius sp.]|uniref:hypothetical protein n=1 Tax=uncultured Roseovarius sp. TaxID=293344 RepID=UPI0026334AE7|nr:hypothetical protein [uncultured Roseovarius sp.]
MQSISSISGDDWEARGDTLDSQIDGALLPNETIRKIRQIRANISKARAMIEVRSHNNPPELIDEQAEVNALIDETSIALNDAKEVVDKPGISSERLRSLVAKLYRLLVRVSNHTGKLIDVALKKRH